MREMTYGYLALLIALVLLLVGGASVYTGHPDGNWLVAPGILILVILALAGGAGIGGSNGR